MGTHQDHSPDDAEKGVARMLRDGQNEPLARAKETLKERLMHKMLQDVLEDFQDTDRVVAEALEGLRGSHGALLEAREALKRRLLDQLLGEAIEALGLEARQERQHDAALQEVAATDGTLQGVKAAFKERLLENILQQAITEIGDEVEDAPGVLQKRSSEERSPAHVPDKKDASGGASEAEAQDEAPAAGNAPGLEPTPADEAADVSSDASAYAGDEVQMMDMRFWADEEGLVNELLDSALDVLQPGKEDPEEGNPGFFLLSGLSEPGISSENASSAEVPQPDLVASAALPEYEVPLDLNGDGSWYSLESADLDEHDAGVSLELFEEASDARAGTAVHPPDDLVLYVYGILSDRADDDTAPLPSAGIDASFPVFTLEHANIQAVLSRVRRVDFSREVLAANMTDAAWREAYLQAHDALIAQIAQHGTMLPVPAGTVYETEDEVRSMLGEIMSLEELERLQGKAQWQLKVYRNRETLHQRVVEDSEVVLGLMAEIKSKPKGGAQDVKKKMVATIQEEMASITERCTRDVHERLLALAEEAEPGTPDPRGARERGEWLLDVTYLVEDEREERFRACLEDLEEAYADFGFVIEVSGPAPPAAFSRFNL